MKHIIITIGFKDGKGAEYIIPMEGIFNFNAIPTLELENNPIVEFQVFTRDSGHPAPIGESGETTGDVNYRSDDSNNNNSRS